MGTLIVDPDPHSRHTYAVNLNANGRCIHEAGTLHAAWYAATTLPLRLIIMDFCAYPDGSALEFIDRLAQSPDTARLQMILIAPESEHVSALSNRENVRQVMIHPVSMPSLVIAVNDCLGAHISFNRLSLEV
jgi:response regulator RpfG family c-di-GMP phosphodiesterase